MPGGLRKSEIAPIDNASPKIRSESDSILDFELDLIVSPVKARYLYSLLKGNGMSINPSYLEIAKSLRVEKGEGPSLS